MWKIFAAFGIAFFVTFYVTPLIIWLSIKINALDHPEGKLKPQTKPIPNLGGFAVFAGFSFTLLLSYLINVIDTQFVLSILIGSIFMLFVGYLDDRYDIKSLKLYAHIFVGIVITLFGLHFNFISNQLLKYILTISIVILACNSLNLIDGVDGLAAGVVSIASLFFFILFTISGSNNGILTSLALLGSTTAFLIFNFSPAAIYLGNNGSLFLGLNIGIMMIIYPQSENLNTILPPIIIFAIPITDTVLAFIRRSINHQSFFCGDRSHFYDHLLRNGLSLKKTILIIYMICSMLGGIALIMSFIPLLFCMTIFLVITFCLTIIILKMKFYKIID